MTSGSRRVFPAAIVLLLALGSGGCGTLAAAPERHPRGPLAALPPDPVDVPGLRAVPVAPHAFRLPVAAIASPVGPGAWYIVEQGGRILRLVPDGGAAAVTGFADLTDRVDASGVESGLLGFAFDPRFESTGLVYVSYVASGLRSRLSRFQVPGPGLPLDPGSEQVLLELRQPGDVHNGGKIVFGPDGYLYMGFGDGAQGLDPLAHGQNPGTLFGAVLRLDVSGGGGYRIPGDNPFAAGGGRPEVFAYGFRNPWGIAFDRESGTLWVADVGERDREEIDIVVAGGNYGWSVREGTRCLRRPSCDAAGLIDPVHEYTHADGCSVTGGTVYRGGRISWLRGAYVFSDWCGGTIWALYRSPGGTAVARVLANTGYNVSAIGEDAAGELYVLDYNGGGFYRLEP